MAGLTLLHVVWLVVLPFFKNAAGFYAPLWEMVTGCSGAYAFTVVRVLVNPAIGVHLGAVARHYYRNTAVPHHRLLCALACHIR